MRLGIGTECCFCTHAPKLERAGLLDLDSFGDYAALLVGPQYADFGWGNLLNLAQHHDIKI